MPQERLHIRNFKKLVLFTLGFVFLVACKEDKRKQKTEVANNFLTYYLKTLIKDGSPVIFDAFANSDSQRCLLEYGKEWQDAGFDTKFPMEENLIVKSLPQTSKAISKAELPDLRQPNSWKKFKQLYPNGFYTVTTPLVNEELDKVIISYGYLCDERCGKGETLLFERHSNGWKLVKRYCNWIS